METAMNGDSFHPAIPCSRLYFMHIPKTAGTSLRLWLSDLFHQNDRLNCDIVEQLTQFSPEEIDRHRFFSGHFGFRISELLPEPIPVVTMLREPLARELSNFNYLRAHYDELAEIARRHQRFGWINYFEFVRTKSISEICQSDLYLGFSDNLQTRYLAGAFPNEISESVDRFMLERAKSNLNQLWHFGLCEQMAPSIDLLSYRLACPRRLFEHHANKSVEPGVQLPNASDQSIILDVNRFDIELYAYAKSLFAERFASFWRTTSLEATTGLTAAEGLKRYSDSDVNRAVHAAVDSHFQRRRCGIAKELSVDVDFSRAAFLSGWYPRERGKRNKSIRWAGPSQQSSVFVPIDPRRSYSFMCDAHFVASYDILQNLKLRVGTALLPVQWSRVIDRSGECLYRIAGKIPRDVLRDDLAMTEIGIESHEQVTIELANAVNRKVSIATDGIRLRAA